MTQWRRLKDRERSIVNELVQVRQKLAALRAFRGFCNSDTKVADRVEALLSENPSMSFTPSEIGEATLAREDAMRRALWSLHTTGRIRRIGHGRYQAPEEGAAK